MTAVNLLMADRAIAITGGSQVVECGRHNSNGGRVHGRLREIGVALQANKTNFGTRQHLWIGRPVRFVATLAAFRSHGRVFIRKGPPKIPMTGETTRFIPREGANLLRQKASVRVVAI